MAHVGHQPRDPTNSFVEIVQIGRNFVHHKDVTLYYNSGHGRGGRLSVVVMFYVLCAKCKLTFLSSF